MVQHLYSDNPPGAPASQTTPLAHIVWLTGLLTALLLLVWFIVPAHPFEQLARYLPLHTYLETFSIVIASLVFAIGWNSSAQEQPGHTTFIAASFLGVALLNLAAMLSFTGMPDFVTPASVNKATWFRLPESLVAAVALLVAALRPWQTPLPASTRAGLLALSLALVGIVYYVVLFQLHRLPTVCAESAGLTTCALNVEYLIIGIHLFTAGLLVRQSQHIENDNTYRLLAAVLILSLSHVAFVLHSSATDIFSLLGHMYKVVGYVFIYQAIFVSSVRAPYEKLRQSEQQLWNERDALRASEERFRLITENAHDVIYRYRLLPEPGFEYVNPAVTNIVGYTPEDYYADPELGFKVVHPDDRALLERIVQTQAKTHETVLMRWVAKDGRVIWTEQSDWPVYDKSGTVIALEGIVRDITDRKQTEEYMTMYDPLTNLPNLMLFHDRLQQVMLRSQSTQNMFAVLFVDLDQFKSVNDTLSHVVGDRLLQIVAERLRLCVRERDTIARLGSDEYTIILADIRSAQDAAQVAQQILNTLSNPFYLLDHEVYISASIGITLYPEDARDADLLIKYADVAMDRAKNQGRNTYVFYTGDMQVRTLEWLTLKNDMRKSILQNDFCLHYQPQLDLHTGQVAGLEALVRWQHPEMGLIGPDRFIPIAEESGLIILLGEWVLHAACSHNRFWQEHGWPEMRVAVNMSALQLVQANVVRTIDHILHETGLDARYLEMELTESMLMHDTDLMIARLHELKALGVRLAIDDFGTGYSSLAYLKHLPIDTLKIDRSFVRDIPTDPDGANIAVTIIDMAHNLNMRVIAEGVESSEQHVFLREHACDEIQGYLYSRPLPFEEVAVFLQQSCSYPLQAMPFTPSTTNNGQPPL